MEKKDKNLKKDKAEENGFPGYPIYPASEDIYANAKEEVDLDPEQPDHLKTTEEQTGSLNEKNFNQSKSGDDLDIPGSELDDRQEDVGSEDEENNLYSLGGDKD